MQVGALPVWTDIENLAPPPFLYRSITSRLKGMQNEYKQHGCVFVAISSLYLLCFFVAVLRPFVVLGLCEVLCEFVVVL